MVSLIWWVCKKCQGIFFFLNYGQGCANVPKSPLFGLDCSPALNYFISSVVVCE